MLRVGSLILFRLWFFLLNSFAKIKTRKLTFPIHKGNSGTNTRRPRRDAAPGLGRLHAAVEPACGRGKHDARHSKEGKRTDAAAPGAL